MYQLHLPSNVRLVIDPVDGTQLDPIDEPARLALAAEVRALASQLLGQGLLTEAEFAEREATRHDEAMCRWHAEQEDARALLVRDINI